ncbi:hypothetical protein TrVE_jg1403 [Triparma verrucosa]|uniref:Uncharacterized protein n=1 Tax=Triparma verrucosa TaxID=1606542 RepID=A0A9W7C7E1_9STRA|nr:hypothetical protein TrVE_jg1403 [Triparma verrucosa]
MSEDPERTTASKMVEALQAELKETAASLQAEREALAQLKEQAAAQLDAERKAKEEAFASLRAKDEAVMKLEAVVAEINGDANLQAVHRNLDSSAATTEPLDRNNPGVTVLDNNVRSENTTISRFTVDIHEEPQAFLKALLGDHPKVVAKRLFQKVLEEGVLYWSFMAGNNKSCDLLLRMCVERQDEEEIFIRVTAVEEEELYSSLPNAHSTAAKKLRLLFKEGTIVLQPLPFGQTSFTFMAQVDVGEVMKDAVVSTIGGTGISRSPSSGITRSVSGLSSVSVSSAASKDPAVKKIGARGGDAAKGHELFYKLATMFYDRFKKEDVIDEKRKADFVKSKILNAPPLTAIDEFRQDDRIDAAEREEFTTFVKEHWKEEVYSVEELLLINKGKANVKAIMDSADLKVVDSGDPMVSLRVAHLEDDRLGTGAFESVIDAEMEELVAFDCLKMSREAKRNYKKKGGIERLVKKVNGHSFYVLSRRDLKVPGFTHREILAKS